MKQRDSKLLIFANISNYNEKIIIGTIIIKNGIVEKYFDEKRMSFLESILIKTKYMQLKYFYDFICNQDINISDIKNISIKNTIIEIQNRDSMSFSTLDEAKKLFFKF